MRFLVSHIIDVIAEHIGGGGSQLCSSADVARVLKHYNRINEILMSHQDWPGTEDNICLPVFDSVFTLPPRFESIKAFRSDAGTLPILPLGFQYLEGTLAQCHPASALQCLGQHFATMRDLPRPLPVFAVTDATEEFTITIHGTDEQGRHRRASLPVLRAYPDVSPQSSSFTFATITAIVKPITKGNVELAGWDDATGEMLWLSSLAPDESSPSLTRYTIPNFDHCKPQHVKACVSAAYRELWDLNEVAIIQAREPYRLMTQSLAHYDRSETGPGSEFAARALKLLKQRSAKAKIGQEIAVPIRRNNALPNRHGYSVRG